MSVFDRRPLRTNICKYAKQSSAVNNHRLSESTGKQLTGKNKLSSTIVVIFRYQFANSFVKFWISTVSIVICYILLFLEQLSRKKGKKKKTFMQSVIKYQTGIWFTFIIDSMYSAFRTKNTPNGNIYSIDEQTTFCFV